MKGRFYLIACVFAGFFSTTCNALAIGFEVDTPLDPFLGGVTKFKRNMFKRLKGLTIDDTFGNAFSDQANMFFGQPPISLPPFLFSDQLSRLTPQIPLSNQMALSNYDQRKLSIPFSAMQQMDAQLANFIPFQAQTPVKRGTGYQSLCSLRQQPNYMHSNSPCPCIGQFPGAQ